MECLIDQDTLIISKMPSVSWTTYACMGEQCFLVCVRVCVSARVCVYRCILIIVSMIRLDHRQVCLGYYEYSIQEKYLSLQSKSVIIKL